MIDNFLNDFTAFFLFDRVLFDNILTTIIYGFFIWTAVKHGATWLGILIGYLFIGAVLTFLGISSYLNLVSIITDVIQNIFSGIDLNPF